MAEQTSLTVASDVKPERSSGTGHALVRATPAEAFRAEPIGLDRRMSSGQALVVVTSSCLRQIALNQAGVRAGSSEAIHQMRVGLRRLRAAFSLFESVLRPGEFDDLKRELVWLTEQLAAARDYDVLFESMCRFEDIERSPFAGEAELSRELTRRRQEAFTVASHAVAGVRFERLMVSAACGLLSRVDEDGRGGEPVRDLAVRILERRTRRILRRLARFGRLDAPERHRLRIFVKKLRYGIEYFAALFPGSTRRRERFSRELEALQETLGRLNDISVHQRIAQELLQDESRAGQVGRRISFAMGELSGHEQAELRELVAHVAKLKRRLAKAPRFWH